MSTAMTTSAQASRTAATGRFWVSPPSTSRRSPDCTGAKALGTAMLARTAWTRLPLR